MKKLIVFVALLFLLSACGKNINLDSSLENANAGNDNNGESLYITENEKNNTVANYNRIWSKLTEYGQLDYQIIAMGYSQSFIIKEDNSLWVWDSTFANLLDENGLAVGIQFEKIMSDVVSVAANSSHALAIKEDGSLWAWGVNEFGLGDGATTKSNSPIMIMDEVISIAVGEYTSFAVKTDGSLWAWGVNDFGQLGDGTTEGRHSPVKIMEGIRLP